jgi:hypothetical protein
MNGSFHHELAKAKTADAQRAAEHAQMIRDAAEATRAPVRNSQRNSGTASDAGRIVRRVRSLLRPRTA